MGLRTCAITGKTLKGVLSSVLVLLAFVACVPQLAFAQESTQVIDGTMTITLQGGASGGGAGGGAGTSGAIATSASATSGGISSNVLTGDTLIWLILGIVVLLAGVVYVLAKSKRLVGARATAGTIADATANATTGTPAENLASTKRKTIIVAVVTALVVCACFGMFVSKSNAFAKEGISSIIGNSNVVVDAHGNVLSNDLIITNNSDKTILIKNIQAPDELNGWNASIKDTTVESGSFVQGSWDGKTIPATLLEQVKNNSSSSIKLSLKITITDTESSLDFDKFTVDAEGAVYDGKQITPAVKSDTYKQGTDFEVVYGENKNAGEGTITIKGIGDYKGEQTFTFTINQREVTLTWSGDSFTYNGQAQGPTATAGNIVEDDKVVVTVEGTGTNAGTHVATATALDNANYKLPEKHAQSFTIAPKDLTIVWDGQAPYVFEYNGNVQAPTATAQGVIEGEVVPVLVDGAQADVGTYTATATIDDSNYKLADVFTQSFTITPKELTLTWSSETSFTYNKSPQAPTATVDGVVAGDKINFTVSGAQTNAGTYEARASIDNANYVLPEASTKNFTIAPKEITLVWSEDMFVYNGTSQAPSAIAQGVIDDDTVDLAVKGAQVNAGSYHATATINNSNYQLDQTSTQAFTIEQREVSLTWSGDSFVYNKTPHVPTANAGNLIEGDTVTVTVEGTQINASEASYTATATVLDNKNYKLPAECTKAFYITKAPITVSGITANDKTYDGSAEAKLNFKDVKLQGKINDDDLTISAVGLFENASAGKDKTVNIFKLTLGGKSVGNYELADSEQQTATKATINYASIDLGKITILSEGATYTGQQIKPAVKSNTYVQDSDFEVTYGENINAGEKAGSVTIAGIGNYAGEQTVTFDIAKANPDYTVPTGLTAEVGQKLSEVVLPKQTTPVKGTFTWEKPDATVAEGDTSFKATFTPDDQNNYKAVTGIDVPVTVTATKTAFAVYFTNGSLGFYNRVNIPSSGEFDGKTISVVYTGIEAVDYKPGWTVQSIEKATVVDTGIQPKSTANWFKDASKLTTVDVSKLETQNTTNMSSMFEGCSALTTVGDLSGWNTSNVTNMASMFKGCSALSSIGCISGWNTAQVTDMSSMFKDCKTLTTVGDTSAWNKNTANVTNMTSMFENCENLEADCSGWTVDNVGTNHENFDTNAPGVQSPWDKHIDFNKFSVDTKAKTYTANQITPRVTSDTYTEGTDYEVTYGENKNAGQGTITIKSLNKYKDEKTYTFTIEPKELTLTWNKETTFTYDGKSHYPGANVSGAVGGDVVNVKVKGEQTNAGTYTAIARIENTNYKLPDDATQSFTIESRPVTLSWSGGSFTYNGQAQAPTATAGNLVEGDTVSVTVEGAQVNAGTGYIATATALSDTNYKLPTENTYTFAIEKAEVVISGITAKDKIYDGTTGATLDCSQAIFAGKFEGDELSVSAQGVFEDANAGIAKQVNISDFVLGGTSKDNYKPAEQGQQTTTSATITPASIDSKEITISDDGTTYTGNQLTPEVTVEGLKQGSDFTVEYGENINAGKAAGSATITGTGNYTGTQTKTFDIAKADPAYLIPLTLSAETDQTLEDIAIPKQTIPVAGTFTWESPTTHTDKIGSYTYKATFTPDDMKNYNKVEGIKIPVKVTQAKIAFAAYFSEDKSLNFYNRFEVPNVGDELDGKTISEIYIGFETAKYDFDGAPWRNKAIASVDVVDDGISPVSTVGWFYLSDKAVLTTADLSKLDTSKVTDMSYMFYWSAALTSVGDLSSWNTSNVTDMSHMFYRCHSIGSIGNVLGWDTSNVTDMEAMFFICGNLTLDCSKWNVKKVGNNHNLFRMYAPKIISPWDSVPLKIENFNLDTSGKVYTGEQIKPSVTSDYYKEGSDYTVSYGENINAGTGTITISSKGHCTGTLTVDFDIAKADPTYSAPQWCMAEECQTLADIALPEQTGQTEQTKGKFVWDVEDPSLVSVGNAGETSTFKAKFVPEDTKNYNTINNIEISISVIKVSKTAFAVYFAEDGSLNFYKRATTPNIGDTFDGKTVSAVYKDIETNTYSSGNTPWIAQKDNITNVKTVDSNIQPVSTAYWFSDLSSLTSANMTLLNTSNVTNMDYMFANCSSLTSVKGALGFDTVKVTNMNSVFYNCSNLTLDVSGWNIEKVGDAHECFKENAPNVKSPWEIEESFAVYSATDNSLNFYKRIRLEIPVAGATFDGKIATEVYKDIEKNTYSYDTLPWNQYRREITSVEVVDDGIAPVSTAHWFNDFKQVDSLNVSKLITSNTVNMSHMFNSVKLSTLDLSNFDTSCAKNMTCMFYNCTNLSSVEGLESWDTSKVENMALQFYNCYALSADCSVWNVLNVGKNLHANFNQNAPNVKSPWDVGISFAVYSADDSSLSFYKRTSTPSVGDQFENKTVTEIYWNGETVTYDNEAVPWATKRSAITSVKVADTGIAPVSTAYWFYGCSQLASVDVSNLDTSKVTNMECMFAETGVTTLDLSTFNTSKVQNMNSMFSDCTKLVSIEGVSDWNTHSATNMSYMFCNCSALSADCTNWNVGKVEENNHQGFNDNTYKVKAPWGDFTFAIASYDDYSLTFYKDSEIPKSGSTYRGKTATTVYSNVELTTEEIIPWRFWGSGIKTIEIADKGISPTNMESWFNGFNKVTEIKGLSKLDTSKVVSMKSTFQDCSSLLKADVSLWDTSNVTDMSYMFSGSGVTYLDLSNFDVRNVKDMSYMFSQSAIQSVPDIANWSPNQVENMSFMFYKCPNLSMFNGMSQANSLRTAKSMFQGCTNLTEVHISGLDALQVTDLSSMFASCNNLVTFDGTDLVGSSVTNTSNMFNSCTKLESIEGADAHLAPCWVTSGLQDVSYMFYRCESLDLDCSAWDVGNVVNHEGFKGNASGVISPWDL